MRRSLAAAALAVAALAVPASAGFDPWTLVHDPLEECMDCVPQVACVHQYPACPVDIWIPPLP
jgi:hypothetical protein